MVSWCQVRAKTVISPAPSVEGQQCPCHRPSPHEQQQQHGPDPGQRWGGHTPHDHVVAVDRDHDQRPDRRAAHQRAEHAVQLAHERAHHPSLVEAVGRHGGRHEDHHAEVGEGQVHHQEVVGGAEVAHRGHQVEDDAVAEHTWGAVADLAKMVQVANNSRGTI